MQCVTPHHSIHCVCSPALLPSESQTLISLPSKRKQELIFVKLKHHIVALCASAPSSHTGQKHNSEHFMSHFFQQNQSSHPEFLRNCTSTSNELQMFQLASTSWSLTRVLLDYVLHEVRTQND